MSKNNVAEMLFSPDWHPSLSSLMGDLIGEYAYITEYGTIHLIGENHPEINKFATESKTNGPTTSITAKKSMATL